MGRSTWRWMGRGGFVGGPWMQTFAREGTAGIMELITFVHPVLLAFDRLRAGAVLPER